MASNLSDSACKWSGQDHFKTQCNQQMTEKKFLYVPAMPSEYNNRKHWIAERFNSKEVSQHRTADIFKANQTKSVICGKLENKAG